MGKTYTQTEHEQINARGYPGTRQLCSKCDKPTGRCEDDSIYTEDIEEPLCEDCWHETDEPSVTEERSLLNTLDFNKKGGNTMSKFYINICNELRDQANILIEQLKKYAATQDPISYFKTIKSLREVLDLLLKYDQ